MSKGFVSLSDALRIIESGTVFTLKWVTADRNRGTGGRVMCEEAQKCSIEEMPDTILKRNKINPATKRDPSHFEHKTRNIILPSTQSIIKIHIMLMLEINDHTILL